MKRPASTCFADAEDRSKTVLESESYFFAESLVGLAVILTAFAVTENNIFCAGGCNHCCAHFAGVCTALVVSAVFGAEAEDILVDYSSHRAEVCERSADDYVAIDRSGLERFIYFFCQSNTFGNSGVHLPVAGYDILSHY